MNSLFNCLRISVLYGTLILKSTLLLPNANQATSYGIQQRAMVTFLELS